MLLGFDVYQGNPRKIIDWRSRQFACIRFTTGIDLDLYADEHLARAADGGVKVFVAYGYLKGGPPGDAQARCLLERAQTLEDAQHLGPLPLAIDIEDPFKGPPWPRDLYARRLVEWVEWLVEHAPRRALLLYTSPAFWAELVAKAPHLAQLVPHLLLWLADWTEPANAVVHFPRWTIWQNEVKEIAAGVPIDHDIFDGTAEDWHRVMHRTDPHDELGGIVTAVHGAEGRGESVEDFVAGDVEGPRIRLPDA